MKNIFENMPVCGSDTIIGEKVIFMGINGQPSDQHKARLKLMVGVAYTVAHTIVGNDYTDIRLEGVEGLFNSVMFTPYCQTQLHTKETCTKTFEQIVNLRYCKYQDGYEVIMFIKNQTRLWTMTCEDNDFQSLKAQIFG